MDVDNYIDTFIKDNSNSLYKAKKENLEYYANFKENVAYLIKLLSTKQSIDLLSNKLQIATPVFNEKQFIQAACETTVNAYFGRLFANSFVYEKKVNPSNNKNVECQFQMGGYFYNIEVKCADFDAKEKIDGVDTFKFGTFGRIDNYKDAMQEIGNLMVESQKEKGEKPKPLIELKKMDNTLKDFLISSNLKFNPIPDENEVNVLIVSCGDTHDMQNWHNYMFAQRELFREDSFYDKNEYSLVDIVVLSNLYHRHNKYYEKNHLKDNWNLASGFNLAFSNPFRELNKEKSIKYFLNIFPHYTYELEKYELPPSNEPEFMRHVLKSIVGIPAFVKHYFNDKGKIIF